MRVWLGLTVMFIAGCAHTPPEVPPDPPDRARFAPGTLSCAPDRSDRCADHSPLLDQLRADPSPKAASLDEPEISLAARVHLIRSARRSIEVQTFIWDDDAVGHLIFAELLAAARRGVQVRVLVDQLFSLGDPQLVAALAVAHKNLVLRFYNPVLGKASTNTLEWAAMIACCLGNFDQRMHNKLLIVDDTVAITGGRNVSEQYFALDHVLHYRDRDILVNGEVTLAMAESFQAFWDSEYTVPAEALADVRLVLEAGPTAVPERFDRIPDRLAALYPSWTDGVQQSERLRARLIEVEAMAFFADDPGRPEREAAGAGQARVNRALRSMLEAAQSDVLLQTPYLVFSRPARQTIASLRVGQPELRVRVSTNSLASTDAYPVYAISYKQRKQLVKRYGFHIFELRPHPADQSGLLAPLSEGPPEPEVYRAGTCEGHRVGDRGGLRARRLARACREAGVEPDEWLPLEDDDHRPRVSLHSKSVVVDGRVAWIGSHNFDPRSEATNTESGVFVNGREFAEDLARRIEQDIQPDVSWTVAPRKKVPVISYFSGLIGTASRALPIFDIWPFRYTSLYELKDGQEPVPMGHPEFLDRYQPVGSFPGVALSSKQIQTILISAMFGFATPVL